MGNDLASWLNIQLNETGWSQRELARRAGVSHSTVSQVLSLQQRPTWDFCAGIAQALRVPVDEVFVLAGLKPPPPASVEDEAEALALLRRLPSQTRRVVLDILRGLTLSHTPTVTMTDGRAGYAVDPQEQALLEAFHQVPVEMRELVIAQAKVFRAWQEEEEKEAPGTGERERNAEGA